MVFWLTGLSGAGKSTLAKALATHFTVAGTPVLMLDGDEARKSLCADLGFEMKDRHENIRRIASCARLGEDSGLVVCVACITPLAQHRGLARGIVHDFKEIYVKADIETCKARDPKGNYRRHIPNYTGISSSYEAPTRPDLIIDTETEPVQESIRRIVNFAEECISQSR